MKIIALILLTFAIQSWAYTGLCQADLSVRFERDGNVIKPLKYTEETIYEIRPLNSQEIQQYSILIKASNIQNPHSLTRPPLRRMLCSYYGPTKVDTLTTPPTIECEYAGNIFELNLASQRFIHSRKGDSIDSLSDLEKLGAAWAFTEFGACIGN